MRAPLSEKRVKSDYLIVEDDPANRFTLKTLLESQGYTVQTARNGQEALEKATESPPGIVISDIMMPVMDGFQLCKRWKSSPLLDKIPFVFYTSTYANTGGEGLAADLGADLFLHKPQDPEALLERLEELNRLRQSGQLKLNAPIADEDTIQSEYADLIARKLEEKIDSLERTKHDLERELVKRREAEESLKKSEAYFRGIVSDQTEFIVRWSQEGVLTFVNKAYCDLYGASESDLVGGSFFSEAGSDSEGGAAEIRKLLSGESPVVSAEQKVVLPDGSVIWVNWTHRAIYSEGEEVASYQSVGRDITVSKKTQAQLNRAFAEIKALKERLELENSYLKDEVARKSRPTLMVGRSAGLESVRSKARKVAETDSTVLIYGQTGTGKELFAMEIHEQSRRRDRPMVSVNCAAIPETLFESELFGREKGAFTGALSSQAGRFEVADGSTLFLDEVGELPLSIQAKLLRVLQEGRLERLGSTESVPVDVRIIAATNRDLYQEVAEKRFREDLYYRLNVFPLNVPPLRERSEDIPLLVESFVAEMSGKMGKKIERVSVESVEALCRYPWPGNIRELRNLVERSLIQSEGPELFIEYPISFKEPSEASPRLDDVEKQHIIAVLERVQWRIRGKGRAAEILGLKPTTLESRMRKLKIERPV